VAYIHLIFGIIVFIVFLITGQFMRYDFPDKDIITQDLRLLMRSRHIYILFSSFLHILLGLYFRLGNKTWQKTLQTIGSIILFMSTGLLIWAFISETYSFGSFSNISRLGIYSSLVISLAEFRIFTFYGKQKTNRYRTVGFAYVDG